MAETPQPCHNLALNLLSLQRWRERGGLMVVCGVVVAYAPRCASLSPNGLACEARSEDGRTECMATSHTKTMRVRYCDTAGTMADTRT